MISETSSWNTVKASTIVMANSVFSPESGGSQKTVSVMMDRIMIGRTMFMTKKAGLRRRWKQNLRLEAHSRVPLTTDVLTIVHCSFSLYSSKLIWNTPPPGSSFSSSSHALMLYIHVNTFGLITYKYNPIVYTLMLALRCKLNGLQHKSTWY